MSCLSVNVKDIGAHLSMRLTDVCEHLTVNVKDIGAHLRVTCGVVCDVSTKEYYLKVEPTVIWLTPEMLSGGEFNVYSNVDWLIN